MNDRTQIDYSILDRPEVLQFLFHPRPELAPSAFQATDSANLNPDEKDILIPVEDEVVIGARFHMAEKAAANILFFHGNGEIVADYDALGPVYNQMGGNFLAVDYRGYGRSTGRPTVTAMMQDCHLVFEFVQNWLKQNHFTGPIILMGRSLGSASVLELAAAESGFGNIDKIKRYHKPTLIIHAEFDHIIPFSDGEALYDASPSPDKAFLKIPGANHNDIFMRSPQEYLAAVKNMVDQVTA
jgi:fermentation-respiration switch protein FrsA (DUF1100 family)